MINVAELRMCKIVSFPCDERSVKGNMADQSGTSGSERASNEGGWPAVKVRFPCSSGRLFTLLDYLYSTQLNVLNSQFQNRNINTSKARLL